MRVLPLADVPRRRVEAHDSAGFDVGAFGIGAETHLVVVRVAAGGVIGRHPAVARQLLVPLLGDAIVSGDDGAEVTLAVGDAAVWEPGEQHATRSVGGLTALVVEGELDLGTPGQQVDPGDV